MIYSLIYSFYEYLLDINREPGILLGVGATRPRTVKLKAQSPMADGETISLGHLGKQRRSINPAPSTVFLGRVTSELSFKGWMRVSQAKQPKGIPGRGDSRSHSTEVGNGLACAFFQITRTSPRMTSAVLMLRHSDA